MRFRPLVMFAVALAACGVNLGLFPGLAGAQAVMPTPEQAIETGTDVVVLPRTVGASLVIRACASCQPITLLLAQDSRFFVGRQPVKLEQFTHFVDGLERGRRLTIFYETKTHKINRVVLAGEFKRSSAAPAR